MKKLLAGELAKQAQIGFETIRYYEKRGILPKPKKTTSGYREYSENSIAQVKLIKKMQELGFSLTEIKRLFLEESRYQGECQIIETRLKGKIDQINKKISKLEEVKETLSNILITCHQNVKKSSCPLFHELNELENK